MYTYWQHIWTGTCHRALSGEEWNCGLWVEISKTEYDDWVMMRQMMWMWTPEQIGYPE